MGYRIQYCGELTITPALTESEHDRLLALCGLDNPRAKDVFAVVSHPTPEDREIGRTVNALPWTLLFYGWYIGPGRGESDPDTWILQPPDSEMSGGNGGVEDALIFLHAWLKANGHRLEGELDWSGSDAGGDEGTIYVDPVHGVEAVEDVRENPGPSWVKAKTKKTPEEIGRDWAREQIYKQEVHVEPSADNRKLYVIEFLYADNNQLFQTFAYLTEPESQRVQGYLERLQEYGEIEGPVVTEWEITPHPSMAELVKEFENNDSFSMAREDGIRLGAEPGSEPNHSEVDHA